jgi:ATP-dependent DNA ligase
MRTELFQLATTGRVKHLVISVDGNELITEWWTSKDGEDGKRQETREVIYGKNQGRSNETSDEEQALLEHERKVRKKKEEGYVESLDEAITGEDVVVDSVLTQSFAPSKPISKLPDSADPFDGTWLAERKHDGACLLLHNTGTEKVVYTRRMLPITDIVSVVPDVKNILDQVPPRSLVIGELVAFDANSIENPKVLRGVTTDKTTVEKSQERYDKLAGEGYYFKMFVFDVIFWHGHDVTGQGFLDRAVHTKHFNDRDIQVFTKDLANAARKADWEGYILRKADDTITYTTNGKPKRRGGYKFKFLETADCVVIGVKAGAGKHDTRAAKFHLAQYENGELVDCGWAGPGQLGEERMDEITADLVAVGFDPTQYYEEEFQLPEEEYFAVEIEYQSRQPRNDKGQLCFEFPIILRTREDKPLAECEV